MTASDATLSTMSLVLGLTAHHAEIEEEIRTLLKGIGQNYNNRIPLLMMERFRRLFFPSLFRRLFSVLIAALPLVVQFPPIF